MPMVTGPNPADVRILRVYIAGQYTAGNTLDNVRAAIEAGHRLLEHGYAPYVPHLSYYMNEVKRLPYTSWMGLCFAWVQACDAVLRLPGRSPGADQEVALAMRMNIPVFTSEEDLYAFYDQAA